MCAGPIVNTWRVQQCSRLAGFAVKRKDTLWLDGRDTRLHRVGVELGEAQRQDMLVIHSQNLSRWRWRQQSQEPQVHQQKQNQRREEHRGVSPVLCAAAPARCKAAGDLQASFELTSA